MNQPALNWQNGELLCWQRGYEEKQDRSREIEIEVSSKICLVGGTLLV